MGKKVDKPKRLIDQVLLTPAQLAAKLNWKLETIAIRRVKKMGPPFIKIGQRVRYPEAEVDAWLEEGRQEVA